MFKKCFFHHNMAYRLLQISLDYQQKSFGFLKLYIQLRKEMCLNYNAYNLGTQTIILPLTFCFWECLEIQKQLSIEYSQKEGKPVENAVNERNLKLVSQSPIYTADTK